MKRQRWENLITDISDEIFVGGNRFTVEDIKEVFRDMNLTIEDFKEMEQAVHAYCLKTYGQPNTHPIFYDEEFLQKGIDCWVWCLEERPEEVVVEIPTNIQK